MTAAMNFFQTISKLKLFTLSGARKKNAELAGALVKEAMNLAAIADQEMKNGETARNLAEASVDEKKIRAFNEIAVWHFGRAAGKYHESSARLARAGKVQSNQRKIFNSKAEMMRRHALKAGSAASHLDNLPTTKR